MRPFDDASTSNTATDNAGSKGDQAANGRRNGRRAQGGASAIPTVKRLADEICNGEHFAQDGGEKLYRYIDGVYKPRAEAYVKAQVKRLCIKWNITSDWSSRVAAEVVEFIRVDSLQLWDRPKLDLLNVKNGLLWVPDRVLLPHSPTHLSPVQLPVVYDPSAVCTAINTFVEQVFPADAHALAWELAAWLMLPDTSIQKAVLLLGEGANGKSVWLGVLIAFLGRENTAAISLHKLEADKFAASRLVGKLANICPDLPSAHLSGTSVFKALVGGDAITGEYKFKASFDLWPFARLVFSANHPPRSAESSAAFFRRWVVVPFNRTFSPKEQIPRDILGGRLTTATELSGLLNKTLDALAVLKEQRGFSEPESVREAWEEFRSTTDPLAVWLDHNTVATPDALVPQVALRTAYNKAAASGGQPAYTATGFGVALRKLRPTITDKQRTVNEKLQWCYIGIGMKGQPGEP